ncbi:hypothetical protein JS518_13960 [Clostridiales bacterium FE2010]|nr:hypothetical protein JS518_13960 [Clostridiales bacterium FE2010]
MRKFDHNGLLLAEYQGKLFEKSTKLNCSSAIFIRRFVHSDLLKKLDSNNPSIISLDVSEGINSILKQFGDTDYGKEKFAENTMFWMGYMYRYTSYTRETSTKFIMQLFPYKQMKDVYYVYHTQDPEWCVKSLLKINQLTKTVFDKNYRLKEVMKSKGETCLSNLDKQVYIDKKI